METTFVVTPDELDSNFLDSLKKLFKHGRQLQISVTVSEDFNLLQTESPQEHLARLEKCLSDVNKRINTIEISEAQLDNMILEKL
jgi:hypothetical protein